MPWIAAWWRRAASIPPPTRSPAAWPATCSAGPPWSSTATCMARWRSLSPALPTACASPMSASAPCRCASWSRPAVALAEEGFAVDWYATQMVAGAAAELRRYPHAAATVAARPACRRSRLGPARPSGCRCRQLAATLRGLADEGLRGFYEGATAAALLADLRRARRADRCRRPRRLPGPARPRRSRSATAPPRCWPCPARSPAAASPAAWSCCRPRPWPRARTPRPSGPTRRALVQAYRERLDGDGSAHPPAPRTSTSSTATATWWR